MNLSPINPFKAVNLSGIPEGHLTAVIRAILQVFNAMHQAIAKVVNANEIVYIADTTQPVPDEGQYILWHDTTGTASTPKAHIVTKQDGATYTFPSSEVY